MKQIREMYKKTGKLHHAYAILGDKEKIKEEFFAFLEKDLKMPIVNNPDYWQGDFNVFKIADSEALNKAHLNKPLKYSQKVFVIFANFMTKVAQNSLLKIFEEPRAETIFFLIMPDSSDLLPTLRSRLIFGQVKSESGTKELAEKFLKAKLGKRLEIITKLMKDIKDEKSNKSEAVDLVKNIEMSLSQNKKKNLSVIKDLEKALSYLNDESPSVKLILEHLAITV